MRDFDGNVGARQIRLASILRQGFRGFALAAALGAMPHSAAWAFDGAEVGKVGTINATDGENYGFRVHLTPPRPMCGAGTASWVYVNKSFDNYDAIVSIILTARADRSNIILYATRDGSSAYCKISYIDLYSPE